LPRCHDRRFRVSVFLSRDNYPEIYDDFDRYIRLFNETFKFK